jgi:hypothetical protein
MYCLRTPVILLSFRRLSAYLVFPLAKMLHLSFLHIPERYFPGVQINAMKRSPTKAEVRVP